MDHRLPEPWEERLGLPPGHLGAVWPPRPGAGRSITRLYHHHHVELEANLVLTGSATYVVGPRRYPLTTGSLTFLFPGQDHALIGASSDFSMIIAVWRPELVRKVATGARAILSQSDPAGDHCRRLSLASLRNAERLLRDLSDLEDAKLVNCGLSYTLLRLWQDFTQVPSIAGIELHPAVVAVMASWRAATVPQRVSLHSLAKRCGVTVGHLTRLFRRQLGITPVAYRNRISLERWQALRHSGGTALDHALAAGFGSYAQFYRVHRAALGHGPRQSVTV